MSWNAIPQWKGTAIDMCNKSVGSQGHYPEWKKVNLKRPLQYDYIYITSLKWQNDKVGEQISGYEELGLVRKRVECDHKAIAQGRTLWWWNSSGS